MITFINKINAPILLEMNGEKTVISNYGEYKFNTNASSLEFTVSEEDKAKTKFLGYVLLAFMGLIGMILEFDDSPYLHFRNALSLPVKATLEIGDNDITVEITDSLFNGYFCNINASTPIKTELVLDSREIDKQYRAYQKECVAVLFIPIVLIVAFSVFIIISKKPLAYLVLAGVFAIAFFAWYYRHKKNKEYIESIKRNCTD